MKQPKKSIKEIVQKEYREFADEAEALSVEQLNDRLAQYAKDSNSVDEAKEEDESLNSAREEAKLLGEPYREAKKALKLKSKYVIELIKEKKFL